MLYTSSHQEYLSVFCCKTRASCQRTTVWKYINIVIIRFKVLEKHIPAIFSEHNAIMVLSFVRWNISHCKSLWSHGSSEIFYFSLSCLKLFSGSQNGNYLKGGQLLCLLINWNKYIIVVSWMIKKTCNDTKNIEKISMNNNLNFSKDKCKIWFMSKIVK